MSVVLLSLERNTSLDIFLAGIAGRALDFRSSVHWFDSPPEC